MKYTKSECHVALVIELSPSLFTSVHMICAFHHFLLFAVALTKQRWQNISQIVRNFQLTDWLVYFSLTCLNIFSKRKFRRCNVLRYSMINLAFPTTIFSFFLCQFLPIKYSTAIKLCVRLGNDGSFCYTKHHSLFSSVIWLIQILTKLL